MRGGKALDESYVVVIGSSAGGIEALLRLLAMLPADFPAPIIIAQHADPHGPGHLAEILQRQTNLRLVTIDDRPNEVAGQTVYIARAGRNVIVRDGVVAGSEPLRGHPVPSIDALFMSAAENYGDRAIGLILTGMGTDGVRGVRAIKERGGTVLVQTPESAAFPALPAAIPLSHIDYTAGLDSLALLLVTLTAGPSDGDITNPEVLKAFLNQLRNWTGIDFRQYKTPTIVRRLSRLMATAGCETLKDYLRHLTAHPEAYQRLIGAFLIKVTEFFRDPPLFAKLRESILPEIIDRARVERSELRLWSAGCATGEEAYSLAILLAEILGDDVDAMPIRIFATDLDPDAIAFARRGIYPGSAFSEMSPALLTKYFTRVDDSFQIKKRIRNLTVFGVYDLSQRAPFPRIDLVLCRNVLIYFTKELQQRTLQLFAFSLRPGGYLVLGKSETTSPLTKFFATVEPTLKIFRRQGERLLIPARAIPDGSASREPPLPRPISRGAIALPSHSADTSPRWGLTDRLGSFLFESPLGVVVVDRNYDISTINQAARAMLGIHGQGIGEDLIHLAKVPSDELKGALDAAFRNDRGATCQVEVPDLRTSETRVVEISCYPDRTVGKEGKVGGVIVLASDVTAAVRRERGLELEMARNRDELKRSSAENAQLKERQSALAAANEELTTANAELRSANEHLMISAEEAEASTEEVETLNEELQATSEELETLNEELQATVEELNTTNEELSARGTELERVGRVREAKLESAEGSVDLLRAVLAHIPLVACILDTDRSVIAVSQAFAMLAERNSRQLPALGRQWKHQSTSLKLDDGSGAPRNFSISTTVLQKDKTDVMLLLTPE